MLARLDAFGWPSDRTIVTSRSADVVRVWKSARYHPVMVEMARRVDAAFRGNSE
jgi:hypothetical protein